MWFEILGFDIYLDKKAKPWLLEVNLAPSFATESNLDLELKHGVITDTFKLLGITHRDKVRKINKRKEDLQKRIVERTSYKESLQRNKEELEIIKAKKEKYENKHLGKFRRIYPCNDSERQEKYLEIIQASSLAPVHLSKKYTGPNIQK